MGDIFRMKILVLGERSVGKSCLIHRFASDKPFEELEPTVGVDYKSKVVNIDGTKVRLEIWNTAGQERFRSIPPNYYRNAHGAILVYDVKRSNTFEKLGSWLDELKKNCSLSEMVIMIVGNKVDLRNREVSQDEGLKFAKRHEILFRETSAKTNEGVKAVFEEVAKQIVLDALLEVHSSPPRVLSSPHRVHSSPPRVHTFPAPVLLPGLPGSGSGGGFGGGSGGGCCNF